MRIVLYAILVVFFGLGILNYFTSSDKTKSIIESSILILLLAF